MAISQIGGTTTTSTAAAPSAPMGFQPVGGGRLTNGYYVYTTTANDIGRDFMAIASNGSISNVGWGSYGAGCERIAAGQVLSTGTSPLATNSANTGFISSTGKILTATLVGQPISLYGDWTLTDTSALNSSDPSFTVAYLNNMYFVGGNVGTIMTSTDGVTWTYRATPIASKIVGFAWNGSNLYMVITNDGKTATSPDGITWTVKTTNGANSGVGIVYGAGLWVAATGSVSNTVTQIYTSADNGTTWTARTSTYSSASINDLTFANGRFHIVQGSGRVSTSTDGITWTGTTTLGSQTLQRVAYGNGVWVITAQLGPAGMYATSTNGTTWTARKFGTAVSTAHTYNVIYTNGLWFMTDSDGRIWSNPDATNPNTWVPRGFCYASSASGTSGGKALASNGTAIVAATGSAVIGYSPDGFTCKPVHYYLYATPNGAA